MSSTGPRPTDPRPTALTRRAVLSVGAAAVPLALTRPAAAGSFPKPGPRTPTQAIRSYADMVQALARLERSAHHDIQVTTLRELGITPGVSEAGRDLYVATVGTGAQHVWVQGRIHGNEPWGLESTMAVLSALGARGDRTSEQIRREYTVHIIPMYNPDGSELNIRETVLQDGSRTKVDLNRDWRPDGFVAAESRSWYAYWCRVKPAFALDVHHQWLKTTASGEPITLSLGVSLAPGGPTLPTLWGGEYDVLTRQMQGHVYTTLSKYGFISMDRYGVPPSYEIDIRSGVVSAMMLGLNWRGMNPTRHHNPAIFFETSGNSSDGSIGQKARGHNIRQNILALTAVLSGMAGGEVRRTDPAIWARIPHMPFTGYYTDQGVITPWPYRG